MARVFGNINNTREKNSIAKMQEKDLLDRGLLFTWYIVYIVPINFAKAEITQ